MSPDQPEPGARSLVSRGDPSLVNYSRRLWPESISSRRNDIAEHDYRAIAEQRWQRIESAHDAAAGLSLWSEDGSFWDNTMAEPIRGRKAMEEVVSGWLRAFPDSSSEIVNVFGAGDQLAVEWLVRATHTCPLAGPQGEIPPTGRRVEYRVCSISRLNADGLIVEERDYFDSAGMMRQLGLT